MKGQPVIGRLNVIRRLCGDGVVIKVVVHIGQDRRFGRHAVDPAKGLRQMAMGRMRLPAQGVDDPAAQVVHHRPARLRDGRDIGQIDDIIKAKTERVDIAMGDGEGVEFQRATRAVDADLAGDLMHVEDGRVARPFRLHEGIAEPFDQRVPGGRIGPDRQPRAHVHHHHAQIVQSVNVIRVGMGIDHRIEPPDACVQQLAAHVGGGVDQDGGRACLRHPLHKDRAAAAGVLGLIRVASAPVAADPRNPAGGAAAQYGHPQVGHQRAGSQAAAFAKRRSKFSCVRAAKSA